MSAVYGSNFELKAVAVTSQWTRSRCELMHTTVDLGIKISMGLHCQSVLKERKIERWHPKALTKGVSIIKERVGDWLSSGGLIPFLEWANSTRLRFFLLRPISRTMWCSPEEGCSNVALERLGSGLYHQCSHPYNPAGRVRIKKMKAETPPPISGKTRIYISVRESEKLLTYHT